jgi:hypothetical protein
MHRVLYVLRWQRSLILGTAWLALAALLYLLFDISLYPLTPDVINEFESLKAQIIVASQSLLDPLVFMVLLVIPISLFSFSMYFSITRVWRLFLKIQSIFSALSAFFGIFTFIYFEQIAFKYSSWLFISLLTLYYAFVFWWTIDMTVGLWAVSKTPETSSFRATLDLRIITGAWRLANKLLDLPRTPLRTWRTCSAYLLSLTGALGVVMSLSYIRGGGGISAKIMLFADKCGASNAGECLNQSESVAVETLLWLVVSMIGIKLSLTVQSAARKLGAITAHDVLKHPEDKYILYLRSFEADDTRLPRPRLPLLSRLMSPWPIPSRVEEELFDVADGYLPLIAIGRPGKIHETAGGLAYREYLSDDVWRSYIDDKIRHAQLIVMLLNTTEGVLWELNNVLSQRVGAKALFFFDPKARNFETWQSIKDSVVPIFIRAGLLPTGFNFESQALAFYFHGTTVVEIENVNWSVSSYRTAFSQYLGDKAVVVVDDRAPLANFGDRRADLSPAGGG